MNAFPAFVLGLLVGWLVEWVIDWIFWRRRGGRVQGDSSQMRDALANAEARSADLQHQLSEAEARDADLQRQLAEKEALNADLQRQVAVQPPVAAGVQERAAGVETGGEPAAPIVRDDLILINGIGPVIAAKLYQAGINTFEELAYLTPVQLREMVGDVISRLADEDDLIAQAKEFAAQKRGRG